MHRDDYDVPLFDLLGDSLDAAATARVVMIDVPRIMLVALNLAWRR